MQSLNKLEKLRKEIDVVDERLLEILKKRFELTTGIGLLKKTHNLPIEDKNREARVFLNLEQRCKVLDLDSQAIKNIFNTILNEVKKKHFQV